VGHNLFQEFAQNRKEGDWPVRTGFCGGLVRFEDHDDGGRFPLFGVVAKFDTSIEDDLENLKKFSVPFLTCCVKTASPGALFGISLILSEVYKILIGTISFPGAEVPFPSLNPEKVPFSRRVYCSSLTSRWEGEGGM
jgi:hypothetical protein